MIGSERTKKAAETSEARKFLSGETYLISEP